MVNGQRSKFEGERSKVKGRRSKVKGTHVREISKFFWFSSHLIDFDSKLSKILPFEKTQNSFGFLLT